MLMDFKSICVAKQKIYGRHIGSLYLATLLSAGCPEKPASQIFCLARQTYLKYINTLYEIFSTMIPYEKTKCCSRLKIRQSHPNKHSLKMGWSKKGNTLSHPGLPQSLIDLEQFPLGLV